MKKFAIMAFLWLTLLACVLLLLVLLPSTADDYTSGSLRIPSAGINTSVSIPGHGDACGCSDVLWHGGQAIAEVDLQGISIGDTAYLTTACGTRYVLECVSIDQCVTIGEWLVGWQGFIRAHGDVLVVSGNRVYRFVML